MNVSSFASINRLRRLIRLSLCLALVGVQTLEIQPTAAFEVLVPAYGNPCCGDGLTMWPTLIDTAANNPELGLNVILNPASGPGAVFQIDPNYIAADGSGTGVVPDLATAGAKIFGYVATGFGLKDIDDVKAEIDLYYDVNYWRNAGVLIDGVFLDQMSNDLANVGYYQDIQNHVMNKDGSARIIGNPGTTFTNNSGSSFTTTDYMNTVDVMITYENTGSMYRNNFTPASFQIDFDRNRFGHIVHTEPFLADMLTDVNLAHARNAGMIYVTNDGADGNPYDSLPTFFDELVAAVPEPNGLISSAMMLAILSFVVRERVRRR